MLIKTRTLAAAALLVSFSLIPFAGCDSGGGGGPGGSAEQTPEQKTQIEDMKVQLLKQAKVKHN